jgi:hypothetical protein
MLCVVSADSPKEVFPNSTHQAYLCYVLTLKGLFSLWSYKAATDGKWEESERPQNIHTLLLNSGTKNESPRYSVDESATFSRPTGDESLIIVQFGSIVVWSGNDD